jgi:transposase
MPRALAVDVRQTIVERHLAGATLGAIAEELELSPDTVRTIWRRYRDRGAAGLIPDYAACGRPGPRYPADLYETALEMRRAHPGWGSALIRLELADRFPDQPLPHEATLRRWFRDAGVTAPPRPPRPPDPPRATAPHQRWQLDACEQIRLADGSRVSWLTASDEATGALLGAVVFPLWPLDPGRSAGGQARHRRLVGAVGAAGRAATGQRGAVGGGGQGLPARPGLVVAGLGAGGALEPAAA